MMKPWISMAGTVNGFCGHMISLVIKWEVMPAKKAKSLLNPRDFASWQDRDLKTEGQQATLDSVNKYLACEHGIVLIYPAFTRYHIELGEISSYPEGYKENAGVFCHNNPWVIIAETMTGNGDRAFDYFTRISPAHTEDKSELHKTEPYVFAQMIAGKEAFKPGEAKNSWLTGTAAWTFFAASQYILGIRPELDGLRVDPCIPQWKELNVSRKFRNSMYNINYPNPGGKSKGIREMNLDGTDSGKCCRFLMIIKNITWRYYYEI